MIVSHLHKVFTIRRRDPKKLTESWFIGFTCGPGEKTSSDPGGPIQIVYLWDIDANVLPRCLRDREDARQLIRKFERAARHTLASKYIGYIRRRNKTFPLSPFTIPVVQSW